MIFIEKGYIFTMEQLKKRLPALILAILMALSALFATACADEPQPQEPTTDDQAADEQPEVEEPKQEKLPLDLPEVNYDGSEVHFIAWSLSGQVDPGSGCIPWEEIDVEKYSGDLLGDAIYDRNEIGRAHV